jgi:hypothetical protein
MEDQDDFVPNANSERKKIDLSAQQQDHYATMGLGGERDKKDEPKEESENRGQKKKMVFFSITMMQ